MKKIIIFLTIFVILAIIAGYFLFWKLSFFQLSIFNPNIIKNNVGDYQVSVKNSNDHKEIKKAFDNAIENIKRDNTSRSTPQSIVIDDSNGKPVSLDDFTSAIEVNINNNIWDLLDRSKYDLASCLESGGGRSYGMIIQTQLFRDRPELYEDLKGYAYDWEASLFHDTRTILFPGVDPSELDRLNPKVEFKDGKYRSTDINLPEGGKGTIAYKIVGDRIIVSGSVDCMDKLFEQEEPGAP